ncbi:oxidoreductase [uncultured Rheinheimera sp.]|uniref:oxidoreductase n=1 Tax=uncultured Rheinheimera sp. TaxID=400532 RepID=UPI0025928B15|nr:oxidoreductase [uncultured Rheinheimera sp.]
MSDLNLHSTATTKEKVWFITGANRGIGAEIAKAALASGDSVVVTGRNLQQLREKFSDSDKALALALDVTDTSQAKAAVEATLNHFGSIDILVNNAGYGQLGVFEEIPQQAVERQFATNVFGLMNVTRAVLPLMRAQRSGRIFNLSSIGGALGFDAASVYCATKFAVEGFTESLALEVKSFGIEVTIVEPGFFRTDFLDSSSVQYGTDKVADYQDYSTALEQAYSKVSHQQAGDPAKLGQVLVQLAKNDILPLRYAAGSDAIDYLTTAYQRRLQELNDYKALSLSTDIEA